jgi:hypothetical protein
MHGLDRAELEALSDARNRWEFMPVRPLALPNATAAPVNPIAGTLPAQRRRGCGPHEARWEGGAPPRRRQSRQLILRCRRETTVPHLLSCP